MKTVDENHPQISFALERLNTALASTGAKATTREADLKPGDFLVALADYASQVAAESGSYVIRTRPDCTHLVLGNDATGALYGCLHAARLAAAGQASFDMSESPAFRYRGVAVPLQLMELIYDGVFYDFPITRENFPFFYDQAHWTRVLDMLVENRMNVLYLWNGHPFTSLLPMDKYPDAREISPEQLEQNMAMYGWLTREAEKRGIWVVQLFYNIHISHPLAKKMGIPFQGAGITPFTKEYTRYCIGEFVKTYPHVGLLMTLGEAMAESDGPEWLNETILPGVKDGMAAAGLTEEPPVIVRAHATRIVEAITRAKTHYSNILTMHKWNGESLNWDNVRGPVRELHTKLATLGGGHVVNVHLLSNLEPFRWGSPAFIRSTMINAREIGASGLHLYPLYNWAWPYSGDKTEPRLLQLDRDWIWYAAWARYAWNPQRDEADERVWWSREIASRYGSVTAGEAILDAYEQAGPCQPMLLRRFGITGGGRQSLPLGMLMTQLINPKRFSEWILLYLGDGPEGERLAEWAEKEFHGREHIGETPPQVIEEVEDRIEKANAAIAAARPGATANHEEFERLARDMICLRELVRFYTCRVRAGMHVLRYRHSSDLDDLKAALPLVEQSMVHFRRLVEIGNEAYTTTPGQMTIGRRIPFQYTKETPYAHGGGDFGLMRALYDEIHLEDPRQMTSSLHVSLASHRMAFASEQSRLTRQVVELADA